MWWGKEDDEMYHMDGTPANESARRAVRERRCCIGPAEPCVALNERLATRHKRAVARSGSVSGGFRLQTNPYLPMVQGIDLTRSTFGAKGYYDFLGGIPEDADAQPAEGACLVCVQGKGKYKTATLSTGDPDELFIGFKMGGVGGGVCSVTVGGGYFQIYTLEYDKRAEWFIGNKCLPIAGPNGKVTTGVFPDDVHRAIGRVVQLPTKEDPYLGIAGMAYT